MAFRLFIALFYPSFEKVMGTDCILRITRDAADGFKNILKLKRV